MEIILNERKKAKEYLEIKEVDNVVQCSSILIRYFYSPITTDAEIYTIIDDFLKQAFIGYKSENWKSLIEYQIKSLKNRKLVEIDYIPVLRKELERIQSLENIRLEKLAFTLLIIAKYYNYINDNNNNWVNKDFKTIFKLADINVVKAKQCMLISELKEKDMIALSRKVDNLNLNVKYIYDDTEDIEDIIFNITNMNDLGNQYIMNVKKDNSYKQCKNCGRIIKIVKNKKYCKNCAIEVKKNTQKEWIRNKRKQALNNQ